MAVLLYSCCVVSCQILLDEGLLQMVLFLVFCGTLPCKCRLVLRSGAHFELKGLEIVLSYLGKDLSKVEKFSQQDVHRRSSYGFYVRSHQQDLTCIL